MTDVGPYRQASPSSRRGDSLVDILDRVLDKGVVIAGDVRINLLDIELLTLKIRLLIASADKASEMGIDWWNHDPHLSSQARQQHEQSRNLQQENDHLRQRLDKLETDFRRVLQSREAASEPDAVGVDEEPHG